MIVWGFIGLAYPLYNAFLPYLQAIKGAEFGDGSTYITYRNSLIIAAVGFPGALLGGVLVQIPKFGRKGTLAVFTILTGVFLYGTTTALTSNSLLGWNCGFNFASNIMYAVLYGYTPEIFPTKDRGTGNALTATANRIFGIMAVSLHSRKFWDTADRSSPSLLCSRIWRPLLRYIPVARCFSLLVFSSSPFLSSHKERRVCK